MDSKELEKTLNRGFSLIWFTGVMILLLQVAIIGLPLFSQPKVCKNQPDHYQESAYNPLPLMAQELPNGIQNSGNDRSVESLR